MPKKPAEHAGDQADPHSHGPGCDCEHCRPHGAHDMDPVLMRSPRLHNMPHQHAMTLVGHKTVFAIHMTQFHMEEHKYQLVFEASFPSWVAEKLDTARRQNPKDWFILSNAESDEFTIPDLASGRKRTYRAQIFQGLPEFSDEDEKSPHFYPWSPDRARPLIDDFDVEVKRIVTFRPFAHHLQLPEFATYLLFGKGREAHLTNLQTAHLQTGPFQTCAFGPDYDHVMSLARRPDGLADAQLEAGIVVTLPAIRLRDRLTGEQTIPGKWPFNPGDDLRLLYRGMLPEIAAVAGESFLFATAVCSSPETLRNDQVCLDVTPAPRPPNK
jgi:hypothetical protein